MFVHPGTQESYIRPGRACESQRVAPRRRRTRQRDEIGSSCTINPLVRAENTAVSFGGCDRACAAQVPAVVGDSAAAAVAERYSWTREFDDLFGIYARYARLQRERSRHENEFTIGSYSHRTATVATALLRRPASSRERTIRLRGLELFADFLTTYYTDHEPESC
jgi:hypothetical protein